MPNRKLVVFAILGGICATSSCTLEPKRSGNLRLTFGPRTSQNGATSDGDRVTGENGIGGEGEISLETDSLEHVLSSESYSAATSATPRILAVPPSTAAGFPCYGVNVVGPGIADLSPNPDPVGDLGPLFRRETTCAYRGVLGGPIYLSGSSPITVNLKVPAGPQRLVQVVGINNSTYCASGFLDQEGAADPEVYELGRAIVDVFGDVSVSVPNDYSSAVASSRRVDCGSGGCQNLGGAAELKDRGVVLPPGLVAYQKITVPAGNYLQKAKLRLGNSTAAQTVTLTLLNDAAGTPGTPVGGGNTATTANVPASTVNWVEFSFGAPGNYFQFATTTYWLRLTAAASAVRWFSGGVQTGGPAYLDSGSPATAKPVSAQLASAGTPQKIAVGTKNTCVSYTNRTYCFGATVDNAIGEATYTPNVGSLKDVPGNPTISGTVQSVAIGTTHGCVVLGSGQVQCWGKNTYGEVGNGTNAVATTPMAATGLTTATQVSAGENFSCARTSAGGAWCWGLNGSGQVGDGTTTNMNNPVQVSTLTTGVTKVAAGFDHACALKTDGTVWCWGNNSSRQLGPISPPSSTSPIQVTGVTGATDLTVGYQFSCATVSGGAVMCWGRGDSGQRGDGTLAATSGPVTVVGSNSVQQILAGRTHACARGSDMTVKCWGDNTLGQLGNGNLTTSSSPVQVKTPNGAASLGQVNHLAQGSLSDHTCATVGSGDVLCWGSNTEAQLGLGSVAVPWNFRNLPVESAFFQSFAYDLQDCVQP